MKYFYVIIIGAFIFFKAILINAQPEDKKVIPPEYFKFFYEQRYDESFHEIDKFDEAADPKSDSNFFIVKYNEKGKHISIGYYTRTGEDEKKKLILTQYVNFEGLPYYFITYKYDDNSQVIKKAFKDKDDIEIAFYKYIYNKEKLLRVEKWGKTKYLGKDELKSYIEYTWKDGGQLETFSYYNKKRLLVERYHFSANPNSGESTEPKYLVGNNLISMLVLERYERFRVNSKNEDKLYYVQYKKEDNAIIQEKYNNDDLLVEELPPVEMP